MSLGDEFEAPPAKDATGHPLGLFVLFGAEMWERFSYYGMRALLVLYLTKHLTLSRKDALDVYATYTGLVYLTPLIGGYLADRLLGQRKAILIGGIVMALGHFAMAFEPLLHLALGLLIVGNGFFKPNISTMVGGLYPQGDARRDGAYTIFYMGINLGAFFSPLVCGSLGEKVGWHYGFGAAGVGMVLGLIVFAFLQQTLGSQGFPPGREVPKNLRLRTADWVHVALFSAGILAFVYGFLAAYPHLRSVWAPKEQIARFAPHATDLTLLCYRCLLVLGVVGLIRLTIGATPPLSNESPGSINKNEERFSAEDFSRSSNDREERFSAADGQRIAVILIVATLSMVFWMGFEQAGGTLTLFADEKTDRTLFGWTFPASWYQSVNPLLIVLLGIPFSMMWTALDRTRFGLTSTAKMGVGMLLLGVGFVVMYQADRLSGIVGRVGPFWLAGVYLLFTLGELCLSPIGLSLVNKLAPARVASLMMAVWFLSTAFANYLAGKLEHLLSGSGINLWAFLIASSVIPGLILLALTVPLKKLGHGRL